MAGNRLVLESLGLVKDPDDGPVKPKRVFSKKVYERNPERVLRPQVIRCSADWTPVAEPPKSNFFQSGHYPSAACRTATSACRRGRWWSSGTIDLARQRWVRLTIRKVCTVYIPDGLQVAALHTRRRRSAAPHFCFR